MSMFENLPDLPVIRWNQFNLLSDEEQRDYIISIQEAFGVSNEAIIICVLGASYDRHGEVLAANKIFKGLGIKSLGHTGYVDKKRFYEWLRRKTHNDAVSRIPNAATAQLTLTCSREQIKAICAYLSELEKEGGLYYTVDYFNKL